MDTDDMQFGFMPGYGTARRLFSFERVTREIFSKKEEFVLCICRFEESFWSRVSR